MASAAATDSETLSLGTEEGDVRHPIGSVTHDQIIGAIGRLEGLIEAEGDARREFRETFLDRLKTVEQRTGAIAVDIQRIEHKLSMPEHPGAIVAIVKLFERQPLLSVVIGVVVLALGSGGVISIWEAITK